MQVVLGLYDYSNNGYYLAILSVDPGKSDLNMVHVLESLTGK